MSGPGQTAGIPGRSRVSLGARFVLLAIVAVVLMVVDRRENQLERARDVLGLAALPFQIAVDAPFRAWEAVSESLTERRKLLSENARLTEALRDSRVRLQTLESLKRENLRLRELLNSLDPETDQEMLIAEILSVDFDNRQQFSINRGRSDRVYVGQPLIDADGIVGQVKTVYEFSAEALRITDASHRVHVTVLRSGLRTIAVGTGDRGMLRLPFLKNNADIEVGDILVTSGLGGVYPRGRPVATVTRVKPQPDRDFADVEAEPISALDRDQEVLLVWLDDEASDAGPELASAPAEVAE